VTALTHAEKDSLIPWTPSEFILARKGEEILVHRTLTPFGTEEVWYGMQ